MANMPPSEPGAAGAGSGPDWGEMKGKLQAARGADRIILVAGLVFFIDAFLPWYGVRFRAAKIHFASLNASGWHSGSGNPGIPGSFSSASPRWSPVLNPL